MFAIPPAVMLAEIERIEAETSHVLVTDITRAYLERETEPIDDAC